jgi:C-terminal processing protease CtpA/Prc
MACLSAAIGMNDPAVAQEIANGGFEQAGPDGEPAAWMLQARGLTVELDETDSEDGGRVLKVSDTGTQGSALVKQEIDLREAGFAGATLRGRIRTRDVAPSATLVAILEGPDGPLFMDDMRDRVVRGDTHWQAYTIYIPASEDAVSLTVGALVIGGGTAWFDDLELLDERTEAAAGVDAHAYVMEALSLMRDNYLHAGEVDWEGMQARTLESLPRDASMDQVHATVSMMLESLDDPHTGFVRPRDEDGGNGGQADAPEAVEVERIDGGIALVRVPAVPGSTGEQARINYAESAHERLKSIDSPDLCGWIVDLRDNTGGNMWPMLAAVGPIAGPGELGRFIGADGQPGGTWRYNDGTALAASETETIERTAIGTEAFRPSNPDLPVAVLVSGRTSSSGEATAIAFIGRNDTRLFGAATGGLTTANSALPLPDGARIVIPVSYMADRLGNIHHPRVQPDEAVAPEDAVDAAKAWLQAQAGCSGT